MKVGIVGLGYVGLPLGVAFCEAGHEVSGLDVVAQRVEAIRAGSSYVEDILDARLAAVLPRLAATTRYAELAKCDAIVIAVPTPLTRNREPDLGPLVNSARSLAAVLQKRQLVVLESTTYPGTTREQLVPLLEESGCAPAPTSTSRSPPSASTPGAPTSRSARRRRSSAALHPPATSAPSRCTGRSATRSSRCRRPRRRSCRSCSRTSSGRSTSHS